MIGWPNYFLEPTWLFVFAFGVGSNFRRADYARVSIFGGGRSGKCWARKNSLSS
jgi:hypothetical protein